MARLESAAGVEQLAPARGTVQHVVNEAAGGVSGFAGHGPAG
jgi:hypothetical protein